MITGAHVILYSSDAEADRAFPRELLGPRPGRSSSTWSATTSSGPVAELTARGVPVLDPVTDRGWGLLTAIGLPGGRRVGRYEARHPTAFDA